MTVRVIGVGSPSGDDQAGWLVIDALRALGAEALGGVSLVKVDRPGAALLAQWSSADYVILVDAMRSGGPPGHVRHVSGSAWREHVQGLSSHGFGVLEALSLAAALGTLPSRLDLYGIEAVELAPGALPSVPVEQAAESLAGRLLAQLRDGASNG